MRSLQISNEGAVHERSYPHWHRHVQECFRAARGGCRRTAGLAQEAAAPADARVLRQAGAGADRHRSLWGGALLGARTHGAGARGAAAATSIREALRAAGQNDAADASAICEAMSRPRMRFVPVKSADQQGALMLVGVRDQLVARRTQLSNTMRGYAAELGVTAAKGLDKIEPLLARIACEAGVPDCAKALFALLGEEFAALKPKLRKLEADLLAWHRHNELSRRLAEIPCVGPVGAALMVMKVTNPRAFRSGRDFAAWLGL